MATEPPTSAWTPPEPPEQPASPGAEPPQPALDPARDRPGRAPAGELTSALSALVLVIVTFGTKWYGIVALPHSADRSGIQGATSAWTQLTLARWLIVASVIVAAGSIALHISQRTHGSQTDTSLLVTTVGTITAVVLGYRVLINMPAPHSVIDAKFGAYLGVLAATGVALGGYESVLAQRRSRRLRRTRRPRPTVASQPR